VYGWNHDYIIRSHASTPGWPGPGGYAENKTTSTQLMVDFLRRASKVFFFHGARLQEIRSIPLIYPQAKIEHRIPVAHPTNMVWWRKGKPAVRLMVSLPKPEIRIGFLSGILLW
jgi:hypothetical protein